MNGITLGAMTGLDSAPRKKSIRRGRHAGKKKAPADHHAAINAAMAKGDHGAAKSAALALANALHRAAPKPPQAPQAPTAPPVI